ncbi:hypothetical protein HYZ80_03115 [Candidatus Parcubacteria bacterium]|nr:hypothetical protein [Candidatus Parcubacteria bacterium]
MIAHSLASLLADKAALRVARDETLDPDAVTFTITIGELYEDSFQLTLAELSDFLEPVESPEDDAEALREANRALGPLPSSRARLLYSVATERLPGRTE